HLHGGDPGGADAVGVVGGLLVALDDGDGMAWRQGGDGAHQQRGLARARAGDEVEGENAPSGQTGPVGAGEAGVLAEDVALDADDALLAHLRHMHAGQAGAVVERAGGGVDVVVRMVVPVVVPMVMRMVVVVMVAMVMVV